MRVMLLNAENLFIRLDHPFDSSRLAHLAEHKWQQLTISRYRNKSLFQLHGLQKVFYEIDPDLVLLTEVGGIESLSHFNHLFCGNRYQPVLEEGNSDRGIDVGFLLKKTSPYDHLIVSHKERPLKRQSAYTERTNPSRFSRDVAEFHLLDRETQKSRMIFLLTHLKSKRPGSPVDPGGFDQRRAEVEGMVQIFLQLRAEYDASVPICLAGDLNGQAARHGMEPDFQSLYELTTLEDVFEILNLEAGKRATYHGFRGRKSIHMQLDYFFMERHIAPQYLKHAWVAPYRNPRGAALPYPQSGHERRMRPSDHDPMVIELNEI